MTERWTNGSTGTSASLTTRAGPHRWARTPRMLWSTSTEESTACTVSASPIPRSCRRPLRGAPRRQPYSSERSSRMPCVGRVFEAGEAFAALPVGQVAGGGVARAGEGHEARRGGVGQGLLELGVVLRLHVASPYGLRCYQALGGRVNVRHHVRLERRRVQVCLPALTGDSRPPLPGAWRAWTVIVPPSVGSCVLNSRPGVSTHRCVPLRRGPRRRPAARQRWQGRCGCPCARGG